MLHTLNNKLIRIQMDIILTSLGDIAKYAIEKSINTQDKTLDVKLIGFISICVTFLIKWLAELLKINPKYYVWYIYYNVFKNKTMLFPILKSTFQKKLREVIYYEVPIGENCASYELLAQFSPMGTS